MAVNGIRIPNKNAIRYILIAIWTIHQIKWVAAAPPAVWSRCISSAVA